MPFSTVFQLYRDSQCFSYIATASAPNHAFLEFFKPVLCTILFSKPLAAFPHKMSSAIYFILNQSKILLSGNELICCTEILSTSLNFDL